MNWFNKLFCKHEYKKIDSHCLGMNPPEFLIFTKCEVCGKTKIIKSSSDWD